MSEDHFNKFLNDIYKLDTMKETEEEAAKRLFWTIPADEKKAVEDINQRRITELEGLLKLALAELEILKETNCAECLKGVCYLNIQILDWRCDDCFNAYTRRIGLIKD